jgi:thymidylate kinase
VTGRAAGAPSRLVELVGPAGAGKSTLARVLPACDPRFALASGVWRLPRRWQLWSALLLLPTLLAALLGGAPLRFAEFAQMVRIDTLRRLVARRGGDRRVLVMDEGPVFALAWLDAVYGRNGDPGYAAWRRRAMGAWAAQLDVVVRLDAADPVIARRIKERAKPHAVKDRSPEDIAAFTARFRRSYDNVLAELVPRGVPVLALRTDGGALIERAEQLHARITEALGE